MVVNDMPFFKPQNFNEGFMDKLKSTVTNSTNKLLGKPKMNIYKTTTEVNEKDVPPHIAKLVDERQRAIDQSRS
jgi:hypothetical protein